MEGSKQPELPSAERERAHLAAIVESSEDAIISKDLAGNITSWNRGAERLYGYTAAEILGRPVSVLIPPDHADELPAILDRLRRGERVEPFEALRVRKDGSAVEVSVSISPVKDSSGQIIGAAAIARDVTEQNRIKRALAESQARFRQAEDALREADRHKDAFLATLAHELRNPLAPLRNAVQLLKMANPVAPELAWARDVVARQVQQMTHLVDDLLDVSRVGRGKVRLSLEEADLEAVIARAVETSRPLVEERRHSLDVATPGPVPVKADHLRLTQVVANLLNNAAKYTRPGGSIRLTLEKQDDEAVIRVKDTGVGIPADMLPRVFDLFTQVDRSAELGQVPGGLGIGLTLVRTLVEMHGGVVEALSDGPGRGSEFVVRLPVLVETPGVNGHGPAGGSEARAASPRRVLVVDDNRDAADSLALVLNILGHEARAAYDGPSALVAADAWDPDVLFLDIGLPGLDGYEVARRLRHQGRENLLLVALTGYGQDEDRRRSQEAGFDLHLVKPVDPAMLGELLASPAPRRRETAAV